MLLAQLPAALDVRSVPRAGLGRPAVAAVFGSRAVGFNPINAHTELSVYICTYIHYMFWYVICTHAFVHVY